MDIQKDYDEKGAASDAEPQSKLDATVTISTPDLVSSCEGSPLMLESFGILKPAEMTDLSNLTVSVEKLERPETNRNLDETFDAIPSEKIIQKIPNTTIVLKESDSISSHPQSLHSQPSPGPDASPLLTGIGTLKNTPSHLVGLTPCHSTPLNDLDEVLKVAAPFVDAIEHQDGIGCGGTNSSIIELFPSKSTSISEAQVTLQCLPVKESDSDVTNSNSKLQPFCLSDGRLEENAISPQLSTAKISAQKASSEESKVVTKPKLPTIKSREGKQVISKFHSSHSLKPGPSEIKGQASSVGRVVPKHRSPLLKIALAKQSSLATPATRPNLQTSKLTTSSIKSAAKPTGSASGLLATALKPVSAALKQTASSSRSTAGASNPTTTGTKFKLFSTFREKQRWQSLATSAREPEYKKAKLHTDNLQKLVPVDLDQTINVDNNEDIQAQAIDEEGKSECLVCSKCLNITFYEALLTEPDFLCDECLAGDHLECEVEDCGECKQIGEMIVSRRQAEVFGRVEKLTGRNVSQM